VRRTPPDAAGSGSRPSRLGGTAPPRHCGGAEYVTSRLLHRHWGRCGAPRRGRPISWADRASRDSEPVLACQRNGFPGVGIQGAPEEEDRASETPSVVNTQACRPLDEYGVGLDFQDPHVPISLTGHVKMVWGPSRVKDRVLVYSPPPPRPPLQTRYRVIQSGTEDTDQQSRLGRNLTATPIPCAEIRQNSLCAGWEIDTSHRSAAWNARDSISLTGWCGLSLRASAKHVREIRETGENASRRFVILVLRTVGGQGL
jgi:hypothetical protein